MPNDHSSEPSEPVKLHHMDDDSLTAILVRLLFLATIAVLIATSFGLLPWSRIFYSHHVAHFAAFYLATFATSAALPRRSTPAIWLFLIAVAAILEILRALTLVNTSAGYLDWVADASGSLAALAPLLLQNYRRLFLPRVIS